MPFTFDFSVLTGELGLALAAGIALAVGVGFALMSPKAVYNLISSFVKRG